EGSPSRARPPAGQLVFSEVVVQSIVDKLSPSTAPGCDNCHPLLLRHLPSAGVVFLAAIYQFSWDNSVLPLQWRQANIHPLLKDSSLDRSQASSYRPLSLTPIAGKLMERIIQPYLWDLVKAKITPFQAGFRKARSTLHNMYRLYSAACKATKDPGTYMSSIFLDLKAAFDRVWIPGLLYKLHQYGVTG